MRDVWVEVKPEEPGSVEAKEAAEELQRPQLCIHVRRIEDLNGCVCVCVWKS